MRTIQKMMASHRLVGGIVYDAVMSGDWAILSQFQPEHCAPIFRVPERIVAYHYVRQGEMFACLSSGDCVHAKAGTMILFPRNDAHIICSRPDVPTTPAEHIFTSDGKSGPNIVRIVGEGPECAIYCGWLGVDHCERALIQALPAMLSVSAGEGPGGAFLSSSLRYAAEDLAGRPDMVARLSQLFFEEAVRRHLESLPPEEEQRMSALRDPAIAKALELLHGPIDTELTLGRLARECGVSRTVLSDRFAMIFGEPPMRYRARWRLRRAAEMLRDGRESIACVAHSAGFGSEATFTRAFKREFGAPPAAWREALTVEAAPQNLLQVAAEPIKAS